MNSCPGHCGSVDRLAFSPDGHVLATDCGHVVSLWNTVSRRQLREPLGHPAHGGQGLAFSPDGRLLATVGLAPRDYSPGENYPPGGHDDIDYAAVHLWV